MMYDVYGFKSLSILNIAGMTHPQHDGTPYGCLQDVLDKVFPKSDWRGKYTTCNRGLSYRAGLRRMLAELIGVRYWLEFGFGTSWQQYRSLDAYVSIFHHGMSPPPSEACFCSTPRSRRMIANCIQPSNGITVAIGRALANERV